MSLENIRYFIEKLNGKILPYQAKHIVLEVEKSAAESENENLLQRQAILEQRLKEIRGPNQDVESDSDEFLSEDDDEPTEGTEENKAAQVES